MITFFSTAPAAQAISRSVAGARPVTKPSLLKATALQVPGIFNPMLLATGPGGQLPWRPPFKLVVTGGHRDRDSGGSRRWAVAGSGCMIALLTCALASSMHSIVQKGTFFSRNLAVHDTPADGSATPRLTGIGAPCQWPAWPPRPPLSVMHSVSATECTVCASHGHCQARRSRVTCGESRLPSIGGSESRCAVCHRQCTLAALTEATT
jgi:hypothetical protein